MTISASPFEHGLDRNAANFAPLTPLGFLERSARAWPDQPSIIHGERRYTWGETEERCRRLASALLARGIRRGETVAAMLANTAEMFEVHFGVPMAGAVLNTLNTRLDAATLAYCLAHGEAKALITDREFAPVMREALSRLGRDILVIDVDDPTAGSRGERLGALDYEALLAQGDPAFLAPGPADEWEAISLNYTSGTTGDPKGVVYHHRGAYLTAVGNVLAWGLPRHPRYLWTLPMFHCNGWCFPWTLAAVAGTSVCLRGFTGPIIWKTIAEHRVSHFCGAPIVLNMVLNTPEADRAPFTHKVNVMTAAAPPPASTLEAMQRLGFEVTHVYGLTETYGPAVVCAWHDEWNALPMEEQAQLKSRQGI
ncbi:MAG: AMP-binding protein, partial [Rhodospirillales bacterium]|nr:AMP-binding protein [Rhodospirillales bacterium]